LKITMTKISGVSKMSNWESLNKDKKKKKHRTQSTKILVAMVIQTKSYTYNNIKIYNSKVKYIYKHKVVSMKKC